ncbi:hypothetical protein ACLOAV_010024 [Pseudogymnoascus australis]
MSGVGGAHGHPGGAPATGQMEDRRAFIAEAKKINRQDLKVPKFGNAPTQDVQAFVDAVSWKHGITRAGFERMSGEETDELHECLVLAVDILEMVGSSDESGAVTRGYRRYDSSSRTPYSRRRDYFAVTTNGEISYINHLSSGAEVLAFAANMVVLALFEIISYLL